MGFWKRLWRSRNPAYRRYRLLRIIVAEADPWRRAILVDRLRDIVGDTRHGFLPGNRALTEIAGCLRTGPINRANGPVEQVVEALMRKRVWLEADVEGYRQSAWTFCLAMNAWHLTIEEVIDALAQ